MLAVAISAVIGFIDYVTGNELSLSLFYLFPIILVNWWAGKNAGFLFSFITCAIWLVADLKSGMYFSHRFLYAWDAFIRLGVFLVLSYAIAQWRAALKREKNLAREDFLTGIFNGRAFYETSEKEIRRCHRYGHPISLVYIDCDDFKAVNDRLGHQAGDRLLATAAVTLSGAIRTTDTVARLGGDEFGVLLPETDFHSAQEMIGRIQMQLTEAIRENGWATTFSIGVASFTSPPNSVDDMIRTADGLMYSVKTNGKNTFRHEAFGKRDAIAPDERRP